MKRRKKNARILCENGRDKFLVKKVPRKAGRLSARIDLIKRRQAFWSTVTKRTTMAEMITKAGRFGLRVQFDITNIQSKQ